MENVPQADENGLSGIPAQAEAPLFADSLVHNVLGTMFKEVFRQDSDWRDLYPQKPLARFVTEINYPALTPDRIISKFICFGLGSMWRAKRDTGTTSSEPDIDQSEIIRRTAIRHVVALQIAVTVVLELRTTGREPGSVKIIFCDPQYTDRDKEFFKDSRIIPGCTVEVVTSVHLGIRELDQHSFIYAATADFTIQRLVLDRRLDVAGMLWADHVYRDLVPDSNDQLASNTRRSLLAKYRRYWFPQAIDGLKTEDIGVRLGLYFRRDMVWDPMARERLSLAVGRENWFEQTTRYADILTALYAPGPRFKASQSSARIVCQEFLRVLGRLEVEQPLICFKLCACAQIWRYQHYFLPLWDWGIKKIVCFGLGSFRNVKETGGPFRNHASTYREVIRDEALLNIFNARPMLRHDPLQAMLRHVAAIDIASMLKFTSSKRRIDPELIGHHFEKTSTLQNMPGIVADIDEKDIRRLETLPPTAGYGGDEDLSDIPVYFHDPEYTVEDKEALAQLSEIFEMAHLPPIRVVDAQKHEGYLLVDKHTLVYTVDPEFPVRSIVLPTSQPAAMIWRDHAINVLGDVLTDEARQLMDGYLEFKLDRSTAPHTIGSSHMYIRKDVAEAAEARKIVPPYPICFPSDGPPKPDNWYLDRLKRPNPGGEQ
ncbi:hypothetical protein VTK56DRAFT_1124 [Thermocarpiscus australiensis]